MQDLWNRKRTKIVATIGPSSYDPDVLRAMLHAGMNVARINFSHGEHAIHADAIQMIRQIAEAERTVVAILGDLQGPKIRLGKFDSFAIAPGDVLTLTSREHFSPERREVPLPHPEFVKDIHAGQRLLLDDGEIEMVVQEADGENLLCRVVIGNILKERKGVSAPDSTLTLPAITDKDQEDLAFAVEQSVDYVAMSFVRSSEDVEQLREILDEHGASTLPIIAKIEKHEALQNIEEIVSLSDGVMVARGDLGIETPAASVPIEQKRIIRICNRAGKPVITATQMLNSMIESPRPTRAEATDVANAIFDGTDAVMLSGESASGDFPVEAVEVMATIARTAEEHLHDHRREHLQHIPSSFKQATERVLGKDNITADAVSHSAVKLAESVNAAMIVCSTSTGYTGRRVARERPMTPIVCFTPNPKTYRALALVWGVLPLFTPEYDSIEALFALVNDAMRSNGLAEPGQRVVIISGVPFGIEGSTNFVKIQEIE